VEFSHHEGAPGQQEIDLRYADALTTADNIMTFRLVVKEVALEQGVYASFMPKPLTQHPGSGMHTHLSLFEGDRNAFYEAGAQYQLSKVGPRVHRRSAPARGRDHAVTNQWVNSYKRLSGGGEGAVLRLLGAQQPLRAGTRADVQAAEGPVDAHRGRSPDTACNPYLAFALLLAAGLKGIEDGYDCRRAPRTTSGRSPTTSGRALGIEPLPASLSKAIAVMERSELVAETLGEHVFDYFLRNKRSEWQDYRRQVTAFELDRYLPSSDVAKAATA
jgi:glutamine synthetase